MDKLWRSLYSDRPPLHKSSTLQKRNIQQAFNKNESSISVKLDEVKREVRQWDVTGHNLLSPFSSDS